MSDAKPLHVRPAFYACCYEQLKPIASKYGYNLVLHGSMNRDLDLIAIPWMESVGDREIMMKEFCDLIGGRLLVTWDEKEERLVDFTTTHHGRMHYVINIFRGGHFPGDIYVEDPQWYIDISILPTLKQQ